MQNGCRWLAVAGLPENSSHWTDVSVGDLTRCVRHCALLVQRTWSQWSTRVLQGRRHAPIASWRLTSSCQRGGTLFLWSCDSNGRDMLSWLVWHNDTSNYEAEIGAHMLLSCLQCFQLAFTASKQVKQSCNKTDEGRGLYTMDRYTLYSDFVLAPIAELASVAMSVSRFI